MQLIADAANCYFVGPLFSCLPQVAKQAEALRSVFAEVDAITQTNMQRVLTVFRNARVGPHMFQGAQHLASLKHLSEPLSPQRPRIGDQSFLSGADCARARRIHGLWPRRRGPHCPRRNVRRAGVPSPSRPASTDLQ